MQSKSPKFGKLHFRVSYLTFNKAEELDGFNLDIIYRQALVDTDTADGAIVAFLTAGTTPHEIRMNIGK